MDGLSEAERIYLLRSIVSSLKDIVEQGGQVGDSLKRKHLVDVLSGMIELSYNPSYSEDDRFSWEAKYNVFLSRYPSGLQFLHSLSMSSILSSLTALLHPQTPSWARNPLTRELSSIPVQKDRHGVRVVVQFLLGKQQEPSTTQLDQIGKVIGSIPSWITAEVNLYLTMLNSGIYTADFIAANRPPRREGRVVTKSCRTYHLIYVTSSYKAGADIHPRTDPNAFSASKRSIV